MPVSEAEEMEESLQAGDHVAAHKLKKNVARNKSTSAVVQMSW